MIAYDEMIDGRPMTVVVNERGDEVVRVPAPLDIEMIRQTLVAARAVLRTATHDVAEPNQQASKVRVLARREIEITAAIAEIDRFTGRVLAS